MITHLDTMKNTHLFDNVTTPWVVHTQYPKERIPIKNSHWEWCYESFKKYWKEIS